MGSLYVGSPETVARKIAATVTALGVQRFDMKCSSGTMAHEHMMKSIELYGTKVIPMVREMLSEKAPWRPSSVRRGDRPDLLRPGRHAGCPNRQLNRVLAEEVWRRGLLELQEHAPFAGEKPGFVAGLWTNTAKVCATLVAALNCTVAVGA